MCRKIYVMTKKKVRLIVTSIFLCIEGLIGFGIIHWFNTANEYEIGISMIFLFPLFLILILFFDGVAMIPTFIVWIISLVQFIRCKRCNMVEIDNAYGKDRREKNNGTHGTNG